MKVIILCPYSYPSVCGVWTRVYQDAKFLESKGYEVHIFSSNVIKGTTKLSTHYEIYEGLHLHRFPVKLALGENAKFWNFKKELVKLNPDIIHAHVYRHPHTNKSSKLAKKLNKPFVLTTHAPFVEKELRSFLLNLIVTVYDKFFSKSFFKRCTRIITITKWEEKSLEQLGVKKDRLNYIPNGVKEDLYRLNADKKSNNILFLGRIDPVKNIECLIRAISILNKKGININVNLVGNIGNQNYYSKLISLIKELKLININFLGPRFGKDKYKIYKKTKIFVLPSHREALPYVLIEAMAAGITVISSKTQGGKEIIENKYGYLFDLNNEKQLAEKIELALKKPINGRKKALEYSLSKTNLQLEKLYKSLKVK